MPVQLRTWFQQLGKLIGCCPLCGASVPPGRLCAGCRDDVYLPRAQRVVCTGCATDLQAEEHCRPSLALEAANHPQGLCRICARIERSRSEEHTSELQSRGHLVCRLLLEK